MTMMMSCVVWVKWREGGRWVLSQLSQFLFSSFSPQCKTYTALHITTIHICQTFHHFTFTTLHFESSLCDFHFIYIDQLHPKMMELPLVLGICHFWKGFKPILEYCNSFGNFWAIFPLARTKSKTYGAIGQIWSLNIGNGFFGLLIPKDSWY